MAVSTLDIAWLAGLLEGEGCFMRRERRIKGKTYPGIYIQLVMTDRDVMARAAHLFGTPLREMPWRPQMARAAWRTQIHGARAAAWMMTILPLMGERRAAKIAECLGVWKVQTGAIRYTMGGENR